jgi:RNA polymerase sigma factor (sigma-70 family)
MKSVERNCFTSAPLVAPENTNAQAPDTFTTELLELRRSLYQRALFLAQDRTAAEDLTQETLERALQSRERFRCGSNLGAWLFSILRNLFIDGRRRRAIHARLEQKAVSMLGGDPRSGTPGGGAPEDDARWVEAGRIELGPDERIPCSPLDVVTVDDVNAVVATLPAPQQEIFALAYGDHLSYRQIALRLGIPLSTTGTRLLRARAKVRRQLQRIYDQRLRDHAAARA